MGRNRNPPARIPDESIDIKVDIQGNVIVPSYRPLGIKLVQLLGDREYTSKIDYRKLLLLEDCSHQSRYALTKGIIGMPFKEVKKELNIISSNLSHLVTDLVKVHVIVELSYFNAEYMWENHREKSLVLTGVGTEFYRRIQKAISDNLHPVWMYYI